MITEKKEDCNEKNEKNIKEQLNIFADHKEKAMRLQNILFEIYGVESNRAHTIKRCGSELVFRRYINKDKSILESANFCKHKLCPFCAWRWHLKYSKVLMETFKQLGKGEYFHLVLTIPNVKHITKDFIISLRERATQYIKKYLKIKDYFLSFEITVDKNGNYHPHYHVVFKNAGNIPTKKEMQKQWAKISCCGKNYAIINLDKCTEDTKGISQELTKYILKFDDKTLTKENILEVFKATHGIRKFSTSGEIKEAEKKAKDVIAENEFEALQELGDDYFLDFYKWFGKGYQITECLSSEEMEERRAHRKNASN